MVRAPKLLLTSEEMPYRKLGLEGVLPIIFRPLLEVQEHRYLLEDTSR